MFFLCLCVYVKKLMCLCASVKKKNMCLFLKEKHVLSHFREMGAFDITISPSTLELKKWGS